MSETRKAVAAVEARIGKCVRLSRQRVRLSIELEFELLPKKRGHTEFRVVVDETPKIVPRAGRE